ncbi:MAG: heptaprenyl diphosphate synthase [Firmicutes bacterium HGW-Firmicutes-2]|nr:MAG: heptaprenyl diphosphate synthase [Firmicutes bacterium HGW-Firmicutes-2]
MQSHNRLYLRRMIILGLLIAIALVLSYFERFIPLSFAVPGIKLGLANVVTLLAINLYRPKDVYFLVVLRVILASIFIGSMMSLWYSMAGGLLSATGMLVMSSFPKDKVSIVGISVVGAICHNIGQIIIVSIITGSAYVAMTYFPILVVAAIVAGIFIGYVAKATKPYLARIVLDHNS